jgi:hypothetical protein
LLSTKPKNEILSLSEFFNKLMNRLSFPAITKWLYRV